MIEKINFIESSIKTHIILLQEFQSKLDAAITIEERLIYYPKIHATRNKIKTFKAELKKLKPKIQNKKYKPIRIKR